MRKNYTKSFLFLLIFGFSLSLFSQNEKGVWTKTTNKNTRNATLAFGKAFPSKAEFYQLDLGLLKSKLQSAPDRRTNQVTSNLIIEFPNSLGGFEAFRIKEASVMHEDLQANFPNIRSYVGTSVNHPGRKIRFSITPKGLHTMTLGNIEVTEYIDPYMNSEDTYMVYSKKDLPVINDFVCEFEDDSMDSNKNNVQSQFFNADDGLLRDYRLALASTIEYSEFHWMAAGLTVLDSEADKKAAVLAAMVVTMTRVNGIYEQDLSVTMTLVPDNLDIIYITSDSFDNNNASTLINQSQTIITSVIGTANYDIGHTFSTGGGGLAGLGVVCNSTQKARGITGSPSPVGDAYDVDYVAHEIGHQFGAPHTFNGNTGNCAGSNRTASNAYEPGSGTTIMAYAGICAPQNIQSNSDDYFHQKSLQMMWDVITTSANCATTTDTGNSAPTSDAGSDYLIPMLTPYKLMGASTDVDGIDTHTFTWEQYDLGPAGVPTETTASGPMVRSFKGTENPIRYIPNLQDLYITNGSTDWEKLSGVARDLNFRLTVRDNDEVGGQTAVDEMTATVTTAAGPFLVTSQFEEQLVWTPNQTETVTWDVAGTTGNGVNTANVNILLSTDGGLTYGTILAANTPNDGSEDIVVPNISAPYCRIMVEAVGNIFFSVNQKFFAVGNYTYEEVDICEDFTFNAGISVPESATQYSGYILGIDQSLTMTDVNINVDITTSNNGDLYYGIRYPFEVSGVHPLASAICDNTEDINVTFDDEGEAVDCSSINNGELVIPVDPLSTADGEDSEGDWIFFITDVNVGDGNTSTWNSATITVCQSTIEPVLSVENFEIANALQVYPNPNNGQFTIKFKSNTSQDIDVMVFDLRGRAVFNQQIDNTGNIEQTIDLGKVQSGMYLLNITDGPQKVTKKIIVN
ncbi:M12 family metallo-peptidase [Mangrovimonas sp. AS39]|uniref:zinc-dependent metalloprotease n=1 Tax=Mangrovimonas futianensis TaxID=2895523 RepID=UPI001E3F34ED|nr:zinc-dependent metalloprotease family protein [Mangrovimonas futianensis]MCF1190404.1 M12 family metallo-peptidase [Mangrovimonas futianensis]MCF1193843.1 M12 family metallo-peptidase [Mangrovimonas futianensis]